MTRPSDDPLPAPPPPTDWGVESVVAYAEANLDRLTPEALAAALIAAGHEAGTAQEAIRRAEARRTVAPTRATARRIVTIAYLLTFALIATPTLTAGTQYGVIATGILAVTLGLAFAISALWVGRLGTGALWAMLSLPLVLLVLVGGACYATTGFRPGMV